MNEASSASFRRIAVLLFVAFAAALATHAQTSVSGSVYGAFTKTSSGNGVIQTPSAHAGGMAEVRHIWNPLFGVSANYSINNASQFYNDQHVHANANEFGLSWVGSLHALNLRPFVLAGVGGTYFRPASDQPLTAAKTVVTYVYGGGLDITLIPHFGLRLQYRGNIYRAPNMVKTLPSTGAYTQTYEPMGGLYISF